jgi:hypothetical protein
LWYYVLSWYLIPVPGPSPHCLALPVIDSLPLCRPAASCPHRRVPISNPKKKAAPVKHRVNQISRSSRESSGVHTTRLRRSSNPYVILRYHPLLIFLHAHLITAAMRADFTYIAPRRLAPVVVPAGHCHLRRRRHFSWLARRGGSRAVGGSCRCGRQCPGSLLLRGGRRAASCECQ